MLRRLSSLLVAIAIIITSMTGVFAAPQFNNILSGEEKIQTLVQTGYIKGYNDGSLKLEDPIKRSEFSKLVVEALEKTQDAASLQGKAKPFTDVELNHWANGVIAVVKTATGVNNNVSVINGYTDGTFRPENFITNAEVLKMLVVLKKADLTQEMAASASWPNSWIFWATELGIIGENFDVEAFTDVHAFAKRGEVFKMFFNTFEVEKQAEKPSVEKKSEEKLEIEKDIDYIKEEKTTVDEGLMATVEDDFTNEKRPEYVRGFNSGKYFDHERFISAFEKLLNEERERKGLYPLKHSDSIQKGTNTRAMEQAELGDQRSNGKAHTRPDGSDSDTAFAREDYVFSECTFVVQGPAYYEDVRKYTSFIYNVGVKEVASEEDIAQVLFESWCNSPGHYKVMMTNKKKYFGVAVRMSQLDAPEAAYKDCTSMIGVFNTGYGSN